MTYVSAVALNTTRLGNVVAVNASAGVAVGLGARVSVALGLGELVGDDV